MWIKMECVFEPIGPQSWQSPPVKRVFRLPCEWDATAGFQSHMIQNNQNHSIDKVQSGRR